MNDSHLLQYPICSLMSSAVRREQLTQNLPMTGVEQSPHPGTRKVTSLNGETETMRNKEFAQEYHAQADRSVLRLQDGPHSEHTNFSHFLPQSNLLLGAFASHIGCDEKKK